MIQASNINDRVLSHDKNDTQLGGTKITYGNKIHDNHDMFKRTSWFGNKQYLWKLFNYKQKDHLKKLSDGIEAHVKERKEDAQKTNIAVSDALVTASQRQRKGPFGKLSGAWILFHQPNRFR